MESLYLLGNKSCRIVRAAWPPFRAWLWSIDAPRLLSAVRRTQRKESAVLSFVINPVETSRAVEMRETQLALDDITRHTTRQSYKLERAAQRGEELGLILESTFSGEPWLG